MHLSFDELKNSYFELITTTVPGPATWSYLIPQLLLPLGLLVPPSTLSHAQLSAIVLPISLAATIHAWLVLGGNDVISTDCLYLTLFLYFFKDPRRDFRHAVRSKACNCSKDSGKPRDNASHTDEEVPGQNTITLKAYPKTFAGRLAWAMMLPQSRPLHDWIIDNPAHDRRVLHPFSGRSRSEFTVDALLRLAPVLFIFLPLSTQLAEHDPYFGVSKTSIFTTMGHNDSEEGSLAGHLRALLPIFMLRPLIMAMYAYSLLIVLFLPPMLITVLLNSVRLIPENWSPHTWRPHFGPFSAIARQGVRGFWGQWWHQQMRHIVSEPGRWISVKMGLADHGWQKRSKYMLVCVSAFALSGITHSGLVPPKPQFATVNPIRLRLGLASFFWVQPVGIAFEMFVVEPALQKLPSSMQGLHEILRTAWTGVFMCFACTFLVLPFGQLGYWDIIPLAYLPQML